MIQEALTLCRRQRFANFLHVFLQVILQPLKDEVQLVLREKHLLQSVVRLKFILHLLDNVRMLEVLQQGDLADGRRRHTVVLPLQSDSLDRDDFIGQSVDCLVDDTVRALAEAFTLLILLQSLDD